MAILEDFELHQEEVLKRLRNYFTPAYFAILTKLLDRQLQVETLALDDYSQDELAQTARLARQCLTVNEDPLTALIELESVLVNQTRLDPAPSAHRIYGDNRILPRAASRCLAV